MADRLTQLQDALDELATQFYACIRYISTNHAPPLEPIINSNSNPLPPSSSAEDNNSKAPQEQQQQQTSSEPLPPPSASADQQQQQQEIGEPPPAPPVSAPLSPAQFMRDQRELARDLILKEQQIEYLISVLPGIGTSEREQEERLRVLEGELKGAEEERRRAVLEKDKVLERLDEVILRVRRV